MGKELLRTIKDEGQDFEWYPTTQQIINIVRSNVYENDSILDIGAGDGRILNQIADNGDKYAIEKSAPLIQAMSDNIVIIGTDFYAATLIDKQVDVIFCNPPYSDFENWAVKIIREANAKKVFLVIPTRWEDCQSIKDALKLRKADARILGTFDFLNAERKARANVNVLSISLQNPGDYQDPLKVDPFDIWFNETFETATKKEEKEESEQATRWQDKIDKAVTIGKGAIDIMIEMYSAEMAHLHENFKMLTSLDPDLLNELDTNIDNIKEAVKKRISGLKNKYWKEVFDRMDEITVRLTTSTRMVMLDKLTGFTAVEFTKDNIHAVLIWVIKNANKYYDQQVIDVMESIVSKSNVKNYKSNQKTWQQSGWRYNRREDENTHYALELRIICEHAGGLMQEGTFQTYDYPNNLDKRAHDLINDIIVIANNLGYTIRDSAEKSLSDGFNYERSWASNQTEDFCNTADDVMMAVKAFKNGNLHIKFKKELICKFNVEFGRLKGWLNNPAQAAEELQIPKELAQVAYNSSHKITNNNIKLLTSVN